MGIYIYNGHLKLSYENLINLLKQLLVSEKVRTRYAADIERVIHYNDTNIEIYVHEEEEEEGFLFSAELKGTLTEAENFINQIVDELNSKNVHYQFDWSEYDENDEIVGEEYELKSF